MRKVRSFLFACLSLTMVFTVLIGLSPIEIRANTDGGEFIYGDLNGDGNIDSTDAALLTRYMLEIISDFPSADGMKAADVNGDGEIDSIDYTLLSRRLLDIIDYFPVEEDSTEVIDTEAPSIPENLEAIEVTDTSVTLKWDASVDNVSVKGYNVYSSRSSFPTVTSDTKITISNLVPENTYTFSVNAFDEEGNESDKSESIEVTTPLTILESGLTIEEQELFDLVNEARVSEGLEPLVLDLELTHVARILAQEMSDNNSFEPTEPFKAVRENNISYRAVGVNSAGARSPERVANMWSAHDKDTGLIYNESLEYTGVGIVRNSSYGRAAVQLYVAR
ncbi:dockerin type I domain-containing protein [Herbivorax sp. ANBcel31]|uniref:dockerin type I domain-containing protein n=1 Tax=Herbivorax sp. ANBcel31 TaxID=3069754 RepID=UPI0027AE25D4|nr:dockerin type I domain-containing protein [Herbivorax sp. ANBcel31]MDQ2086551.1 dockerin type I domain-containing protein [Herbivorax sp. ANBcel31]